MAATNKQVVLRRLVAGKPSLDDLELVEGPIPEAQAGEVLVRTIYLSLDPYMRGRMSTPEAVGEVMVGGVVGEVVASNADGFEPGQLVCQYVGGYGWQSYGAVAGSQLRVLDPDLVPITTALGVAGMPGVTAYFGLLEVGPAGRWRNRGGIRRLGCGGGRGRPTRQNEGVPRRRHCRQRREVRLCGGRVAVRRVRQLQDRRPVRGTRRRLPRRHRCVLRQCGRQGDRRGRRPPRHRRPPVAVRRHRRVQRRARLRMDRPRT